MKKFKKFILEGHMDESDFEFKTRLKQPEIDITGYNGDYDDYDDYSAIVYWHIEFDWMGDDGVNYNIYVDKVVLEYTAVIYGDDDDDREEKELIIDDSDKINMEQVSNNTQFIVHGINVELRTNDASVEVEF